MSLRCSVRLAVEETTRNIWNRRPLRSLGLKRALRISHRMVKHRELHPRLPTKNETPSRWEVYPCVLRSFPARFATSNPSRASDRMELNSNMPRASKSNLRPPRLARFSWFHTLSLEAKRSDLCALLVEPRHRSKSKASRREIVQLVWIILLSLVAIVIGVYGGVVSSHHDEH